MSKQHKNDPSQVEKNIVEDQTARLNEDRLDNIEADLALREAQIKGTISLSDLKRELNLE